MAYRDILVTVDPTPAGRDRLAFALKLARGFDAHLTAYYTFPTVGTVADDPADEAAEAMERHFELDLAGRPGRFLLSGDPPREALIEAVRTVDLAVLGLGDPSGAPAADLTAESVVTECGRPVLGIPVSALPDPFPKAALVAWDGSREAARALGDAIPLLSRAADIAVLSLGDNGLEVARRAVEHLARHGIAARALAAEPVSGRIGQDLLDAAAMMNVDLVVAGAFGHAQLREKLFGGASRSLLNQMLVPVLMSH